MIFLYMSLVVLLATLHFLVKRRAVRLEKKFIRVTRQADEVLRQSSTRDGNSNRADPYQAAKRQYRLALLANQRDRVESRYAAWQVRSEKLAKMRARLRGWKGRKLPYTFGVLDVTAALAAIDYLGAGQYINARTLVHALTSLFQH
jgi:hypothetical protein